MIRKPDFKVCRMVGDKILPKCQTPKYSLATGEKKGKPRRNKSEFGTQLIEKQKVRHTYGLTEKQFSLTIGRAHKEGKKNVAQALIRLLESRLDNVVYRLGLASSRAAARQMVSHGHIVVDGRRVTVPSFTVTPGQQISIREGSAGSSLFATLKEKQKNYSVPSWLAFDFTSLTGRVSAEPLAGDAALQFNIPAVLEFYSRA